MKKNCIILSVLLGAFSFLSGMDVPEVIVGQEQTSQGIFAIIEIWETSRERQQLTLTDKSKTILQEVLQAIKKHENPIKFSALHTAVQNELIKRLSQITKKPIKHTILRPILQELSEKQNLSKSNITIANDLTDLEAMLTKINKAVWEEVTKQLFSQIESIKKSQQLETFINEFLTNIYELKRKFKQKIKNIVVTTIPNQYKVEQEIIARLFIGYVENQIKKQL